MHKALNVKSRVRGDFHARFREKVRVKLPRSTRHLTLTQIKNMKFPGVTNKTIMEVVNNYGLFTEKYDKVIYSAIDFISKGSYIQIQSDCNRIAIGLQSDSFPTHTRDDKDIKIKI